MTISLATAATLAATAVAFLAGYHTGRTRTRARMNTALTYMARRLAHTDTQTALRRIVAQAWAQRTRGGASL